MRQCGWRRNVSFWLGVATELLAPCSEFGLWFLLQILLALIKLPFFSILLVWEYRQGLWQLAYMLIQWLLWESPQIAGPPASAQAPPANNSNTADATAECAVPQHGDAGACMSFSTLASVFVLLGLNAKV